MDFVLEDDSELGDLKREVLQQSNEVALAERRNEELEAELARVQEEHATVAKELGRVELQLAGGEVDPELASVKEGAAAIREEIGRRQQEQTELEAEAAEVATRRRELEVGLEKVRAELQSVRVQLAQEAGLPQRTAKQAHHQFAHAIETYKKQTGDAAALLERLEADGVAEGARVDAFRDREAREELGCLDASKVLGRAHEAEAQAQLELGMAKNEAAEMLADKAALVAANNRLKEAIKTEGGQVARMQREKDSGLRELRKLHQKTAQAKIAAAEAEAAAEASTLQIKAIERERRGLGEGSTRAERDLDKLSRQRDVMLSLQTAEMAQAREALARNTTLEEELQRHTKDNHKLAQRLRSLHNTVDAAGAEAMRALSNAERAEAELSTYITLELDTRKSVEQLGKALRDLEGIYQIMKNEKNKYANQIAAAAQRQTEMGEKVKILQNEIEILRSSVHDKESKLTQQEQRLATTMREKEKITNKENAERRLDAELKEARKQVNNDNKKQLELIDAQEARMTELRSKYAKAVQERNELGVRLIDRHDELCTFYERLNSFTEMLRNGDLKLSERDEEIRFLRLEARELQRQVTLADRRIPEKRRVESELLGTRKDLLAEQKLVTTLEARIEAPDASGGTPRNWRVLPGPAGTTDPAPAELDVRADELAKKLAAKEQRGIECDMLLEETVRLTERSRGHAADSKGETLQLAVRMNEAQAKIRDTTRKLMATISELTMHQAQCMQQQRDATELRAQLEGAMKRLDAGDAPTDDMRREWEREERRLVREAADREKAARVELEQPLELAGGVRSFAEQRPTAYLPDEAGADLPIPMPYGKNAPFKPLAPSSHLRHFHGTENVAG